MTDDATNICGAVVIGRNEGPRLEACLKSLAGQVACIVYVDSGSSDNSLEIARALEAETVELDLVTPFTAGRARNVGFERLAELYSDLAYVQFVDGDCVVMDDWVRTAQVFLADHKSVAGVCGRRRERFPQNSIYNRLCDIEWNTPVGEARSFYGDVMLRFDAFKSVAGYDVRVIAGEEPELSNRLRAEGWKVWRLNAEMTLHDAAMTTFGQWWKRTVRGGYAYALGASLHGRRPGHHWVRETVRALIWGTIPPIALILGIAASKYYALLLIVYPFQIVRVALQRRDLGSFAWTYASFMTLAKFAELTGVILFTIDWITNNRRTIIEYRK